MIKGLNISKKYKKFALQPTSIEIDKGEIVALIGENGAGKSTLIKCMCGVIDADEGQLEVDDQVVKKLDDVLVLGFMNQDQNVYNEIKIMEAIFISISVLYSTLKPIVCITNKLIEEINNIKRINTALENTTKYFDTGNLRIKSRVSLLSSILMILVNGSDVTKKGTKKNVNKIFVAPSCIISQVATTA